MGARILSATFVLVSVLCGGCLAPPYNPIPGSTGVPVGDPAHPTAFRYSYEYTWSGNDLERLKSVNIESPVAVSVQTSADIDQVQVDYLVDVAPSSDHDTLANDYNAAIWESASLDSDQANVSLPADASSAQLYQVLITLPANSSVQLVVNGNPAAQSLR